MPLTPEKLVIKISDRESVTALLYAASKPKRVGTTLILGHGAGANQLSEFMRLFAVGLAARGFDSLTFNFLYTEQGRRTPDPRTRLESCYLAVMRAALELKKLRGNRLVIGGKSMGGRIASQVAALPSLECNELAGLIFLGYPLHPPGKPEQLRDAHLKDVVAPMLFVQGARDSFGSEDQIRDVIEKHRLPATLFVIRGGDHSLKVPRGSELTQEELYEQVMDEISRWHSDCSGTS